MNSPTIERITPEIKAHSDLVARCGAYSIANPSVPLKKNPFFNRRAERQALIIAFGTSHVEYTCPCGYLTPKINADLRVVHDDDSSKPNCNSDRVLVSRRNIP